MTFAQLGIGTFSTIFALLHPNWAYVGQHISWAVSSWLFLMAATDIIITGTIIYFLARKKSDFQGTNSIIDGVIKYTITNNGLTSACAITSALMFEEGPGLWHIIPGTIIIKFYSISLLASLNSRRGLAHDLMASRNGATLARGSPRALSSNVAAYSFQHSPAMRSPSVLHFKDSPIRNGGGSGNGLGSGNSNHPSRAASMRDHGENSFPVQVTIDTTSSEYRVEDLAWEEKERRQNKSPSAAKEPNWNTQTASQNAPPFQLFVDEP